MKKASLEFKLFIYWYLGSALGFFLLVGLLGLAYIIGEKPTDDLIFKIDGLRLRLRGGGEVPIIFPEAAPYVIGFILIYFSFLIIGPFLSKRGKNGEHFFKIYPAFAFGSVFPLIFATQNSLISFIFIYSIFTFLFIFFIFKHREIYTMEETNLFEMFFIFLAGLILLLSLLGIRYIIDPKSLILIERFSNLNSFYKFLSPVGFLWFIISSLQIWKKRNLCDAYTFGVVYALSIITISSSFYKDIILGIGLFLTSLLFTKIRNLNE